MQEIYGLGILREKREPYCFPLSLKEIDFLTINKTKKELLEILKQNDSTITEKDENQIRICRQYQNHWKESNILYIGKNKAHILTFSVEALFEKENPQKILNVLYSHFSKFYSKKNTRDEMKRTIEAMKLEKNIFLERFKCLNYIENRSIRVYLAKHFDVAVLVQEEKKAAKKQILTFRSSEESKNYILEKKKTS